MKVAEPSLLPIGEHVVDGRGCEAAKVGRLRGDFGIECRLVRGRAGKPVEQVNESLWLQMMIMMNRVVVVRAKSKLRAR